MSSAYQLKPWTQVAIPHEDIREGRLDTSVYAASLGMVVRQDAQCPAVYRNAEDFFAATYLTKELEGLLKDALARLCGEPGDRVLQLRTPFGGGKTHALISLFHAAKHRQDLSSHVDLSSLPEPGPVNVASFIGNDFGASTGIETDDGIRILTPWGYLAWQLGGQAGYELVKDDDQQRVPPGNDVWRKIIGDQPTLILLDEFLIYVENAMGIEVKDSTLGRQVLTFIQKLTEVIRELPKAVLVYSLQASVQEAVGGEGLLGILDKLASRIDAKREPVSGDEVMRVVQRRLFESINDPAVIREIADQQADLFRKFKESSADTQQAKNEAQQQAQILSERIQSSYPFHPDLLDLMYHRWGSLPSYQRTRGALQFLARVVYALWENQDISSLIGPGDIPFADEGVRGAFFSQVGERERFDSVIRADLTGRTAKVKSVDKRIEQDAPALSHLKVGSRIASSIMMYSFGAREGEDRGVTEQDLTGVCLAPSLDRNVVVSTLNDLRENLLYLHYVGKRYRFETKANLNKLVADEEPKIDGNEVLETLKTQLNKSLQGGRGKVVLWPRESIAVTDRLTQFSVVYFGHEWAEKSREEVLSEATKWVEQRGNDKRDYKNALAFVLPNKAQMDKARKTGRTAAAIESLLNQKSKYKFSPEEQEELKDKAKDASSQMNASLRRLYDYILIPVPNDDSSSPIRLELVDLQAQLNTSQNLQERVLDALKNYVFDSITPSKLVRLSNINSTDQPYLVGDDLVSYFFRFPNFPKMLGTEPIKRSILKAVEQGQIGYVPNMVIPTDGEPHVENVSLVSFKRSIPVDELDLSGFLLSPALSEQFLASNSSAADSATIQINSESSTETYSILEKTNGIQSGTQTLSASEGNQTVLIPTSQNSSLTKHVRVDSIDEPQPTRRYRLSATIDKAKFFQLFEVIQTLSDKAEDMTVQIDVRANTTGEFKREWIAGAIEEPLDEMDIRAETWLE